MNRNEFNRFIAGIDLPGPGDLEGLRELTALFPWFHSAHLLLLRGLKENSDIRFDSQLKASALSVNDREVLYHYLFNTPAEAVAEAVPVSPAEAVSESPAETIAESDINEQVEVAETVPSHEEVATEENIVEPETVAEVVPEPEIVDSETVVNEMPEELIAAENNAEEDTVAESVSEPEFVEPEMVADLVPETAEVAAEENIIEPEPEAIASDTDAESLPEPEFVVPEMTEEVTADNIVVPPEMPEETDLDTSVAPEETTMEDYPPVTDLEAELTTPEAVPETGVEAPELLIEATSTESVADAEITAPEAVPEKEAAAPEVPADPNADLRTREELIAEIEARLKELKAELPESWSEEIPAPEPPEVIESQPHAEPVQFAEVIEQQHHAEPEEFTAVVEPEPQPEPEQFTAAIEPEPQPEPEQFAEVIEQQPQTEPDEFTAVIEPEHQAEPETAANAESEPEPQTEELLELLPDTVAQHEDARKELSSTDLIDRFIMISPTIERMSPKEYKPVNDLSEEIPDEPGKFITETLAKIYVTQGYYTKAINIYEKLSLQYPEKSTYFASRIEKIKDLIK